MKKYRIIQIGKNQPKFKIQERVLFFFWADKYFNIIDKYYKQTPPIFRHFPPEIDLAKFTFNNLYDAKYVLSYYKEIFYKGETIYPCIVQVEFNKIQILYFRAKNEILDCLDIIKNSIDADIKIELEQERIKKDFKEDNKYKKVVYTI